MRTTNLKDVLARYAERAAKKPGRKPKPSVERHNCGKIVQPKPEEVSARNAAENKAVVIAQRIKMGVPKRMADTAQAGSVVGRLVISNSLQPHQLKAADMLHAAKMAADLAIEVKRQRSGSDHDRQPGHDNTDPWEAKAVKKAVDAEQLWRDLRRTIMESSPLGMMVVEGMIFEDRIMDGYEPELRTVLNEICRRHMPRGA